MLIRASEEAKALRPNPVLAARLVKQWRAVKFETLKHKVRVLRKRIQDRSDVQIWCVTAGVNYRFCQNA